MNFQNSCREYTSAQFVEPLLTKLHPYIGFNLVIMLATGGVKVSIHCLFFFKFNLKHLNFKIVSTN